MILHVFNTSIISGPETLVLPQLAQLAGKMNEEIKAVLLLEARHAPEKNAAVLQYAESIGIQPEVIYIQARIDRAAIAALADFVDKSQARIVHAHDVKASAYVLAARRILRKREAAMQQVKIVSSHHGVRSRPWFRARAYAWYYEHFLLPKFDRVLAVCGSDAELLVKRGLPRCLVDVLLNGVTRRIVARSETVPARTEAWRRSIGLPAVGALEHELIFAYVGRMSAEKGVEEILHTLREFSAIYPKPWHCLMIGSGRDAERFQSLSVELGLAERVHWLGYRSDAFESMARVDLIVSCSPAEGLPITLVEAGWAGAAVAAVVVDGIADLMPNDDLGLRWDVAQSARDKAQRLHDFVMQPLRVSNSALAYQQRIQNNFSAERWCVSLSRIYNQLG